MGTREVSLNYVASTRRLDSLVELEQKGVHDQKVWRGFGTHWSHLEQTGDGQEVWIGSETPWSHLEQTGDGQEVLIGSETPWSHQEQTGDGQEVWIGSETPWSHLEQTGDGQGVYREAGDVKHNYDHVFLIKLQCH